MTMKQKIGTTLAVLVMLVSGTALAQGNACCAMGAACCAQLAPCCS
jgi:hypothetical protein